MTHLLTSVQELEAVYGAPQERSLWKELDHLNDDYRAFVAASPFVVLASAGAGGMDCSPKGDAPGFVRVLDARTVALPDRPGNNRIDNLRNIVEDGRVALLFTVPGAMMGRLAQAPFDVPAYEVQLAERLKTGLY
ncbi:MAG: hypothetical protein EOO25_18255 [Comamonadaceae bacterium]|nr:MAG: hypothetical protein EOO25_18255 [Comamonadaceae bacterium]